MPPNLFSEECRVLAGHERDDREPVGMGLNDLQGASSDRAGRSEDREALHITYRRRR
jgi:hypothetical protein